jgi:TolB protein
MKQLLFCFFIFTSYSVYSQSVLFSENNNGNWDLFSIDLTKGEVIHRVTNDSLKDFQSDYCSCKNKIVFDSYRDKNTRNIFTLNLKTNELIQLTKLETRDGHPVWSPNCKNIAFQSSRNGNPDVYIMDSLGKNIEQLTFDNSFDGIPKWAPNSKFLAFNSNRTGSPNIFLLNNKTKEKIQITVDEKYNFVQDWVSNTKLLIITDVSEKRQMQIVDIEDNTTKNLPTDFDVTYARYKNGKIIFTQKNKEGMVQLYLMTIDNLKQKQLTNTKSEKRFPAFME